MQIRFPFVVFSDDNQEHCCCYVLPVSSGSDLKFLLPPQTSSPAIIETLSGIALFSVQPINNVLVDFSVVDLSSKMAPGDCFRIRNRSDLSNIFQYIGCETDGTVLFEYWNNSDYKQRIRLNCIIENVQSKTQKTEYVDATGFSVSLAKSRRREYEMKIDFVPEYLHSAIKEMLLFPNLLVDDVAMYESNDYEIDWGNKDEKDYAKGETKLSEQEINRYSVSDDK